jgi:hypothetical protein
LFCAISSTIHDYATPPPYHHHQKGFGGGGGAKAGNAASDMVATCARAEGSDITNLLDGLGDAGLTTLFRKLGLFAWTAAIAQLLALLAPVLRRHAVAWGVSVIYLFPQVSVDAQTDRQTGRQTDRQTDRQAGRQTGRQAD